MPTIEKKNEVTPPKIMIKNNTLLEYSKHIEHLIIEETPAVTIVAACIKNLQE